MSDRPAGGPSRFGAAGSRPDPGPVTQPDSGPVTQPDSGHATQPDSGHVSQPDPRTDPDATHATSPDSGAATRQNPGPAGASDTDPMIVSEADLAAGSDAGVEAEEEPHTGYAAAAARVEAISTGTAVSIVGAPPADEIRPRSRFIRVMRWFVTANPFVISVLSIFSALVIGAILIVIGNRAVLSQFSYFFAQPGTALSGAWDAIWSAYKNFFEGAIFNPTTLAGAFSGRNSWSQALFPISETLTYTAPLIFTGLAVAIAFRGGLFNIGAQGQAIFGAIGAGLIGFELRLPIVLHWIVAIIAGAIGGALWGFIPGFLKARTGAHEVVVTIMLNYIALLFLGWIILQGGVKDPTQSNAISKPLHNSATLPPLLGSSHRTNLGLLVGLLAVVVIAWLIKRSTFGFELRAVGANPDAARTAGMSVGKTYILVMVVAGALAGLGGAVQLLGTSSALTGGVVANIGFDGITVALLGRGKPWGVALAALLFGALYAGGNAAQNNAGVVVDLVQVLQALIVIFIAAPALIMSIYRLRPGSAGQTTTNLAKGW